MQSKAQQLPFRNYGLQNMIYLVRVEFVKRPWNACDEVKPEGTNGEEVLEGNHTDIITVGVGNIERALKKLYDDFQLPEKEWNDLWR